MGCPVGKKNPDPGQAEAEPSTGFRFPCGHRRRMLTISHVYDEDERSAPRFRTFDFDGDPAVPPAFQTRRLVVGHGPIAFVEWGLGQRC